MKNHIIKSLFALLIFAVFGCSAQLKNEKVINARIDGNCDMCKQTIEEAAFQKDVAIAVWNKDTKIAEIKFDSVATNANEILKRVAAVGYDNELFIASDEVYKGRPGCCQYERVLKNKLAPEEKKDTVVVKDSVANEVVSANQLQEIFNAYFELKNALVNDKNAQAVVNANNLKNVLNAINETKLDDKQNEIIKKNKRLLETALLSISSTKEIEKQREEFSTLSSTMYELAKVAKLNSIVYYQNCPMYNSGKGGNWLSKEKAIKNPLYGSEMLTCGSIIETIK
jgi:hypothetical protein